MTYEAQILLRRDDLGNLMADFEALTNFLDKRRSEQQSGRNGEKDPPR